MAHRVEQLAATRAAEHRSARRKAGLALAVLAAFGASSFWLGGRLAAPAGPAAGSSGLGARIAELEGALAMEQAARGVLAQELAQLHARLDALPAPREPGRAPAAALPSAPSGTPSATKAGAAADGVAAEAALTAPGPSPAPAFDVEALVAGCMSRTDAEALRAGWERYQLEKLRSNDRAMREAYFMRPRHRVEQEALDAGFRGEVGDDGYDAFLRATGRPNRVAVRDVLSGGAASAAGLQAGDELLRYADARVFTPGDLQRLTASGEPGELVSVEVLRGGQPLALRAGRGPLGVVLEGVVRVPEGGC